MKNLSFFFFVCLLILSFSCKKESSDSAESTASELQQNVIFGFPTDGVDGHIVLVSNQLEGHLMPSNFHVSGNLKDGSGKPLTWSSLSVAGINLSTEVGRGGDIMPGRVSSYFSPIGDEEGYRKLYSAFEAKELDFQLNGQQQKLRLPSIIKLDLSGNDVYQDNENRFNQISLKNNLIIRWNPESNLQKTADDLVGVYVVYNGAPSKHYIDVNLPSDNKTISKTASDDTGEIIITSSEMLNAGFPDKGLITIMIGKSSSHLIDFLDFEVIVGGVTYEVSDYIQLID